MANTTWRQRGLVWILTAVLAPACVHAQITETQARNSGRGHPWQGSRLGDDVNPYSRSRQTTVDIRQFAFRSHGDIAISFAFHHNSMAVYSNPNMAPKWSHSYDTHLDTWNDMGTMKAAVVWGDHTVHMFTHTGGTWVNADGYRHTLRPSGANFTLTLKSLLVYTFEPSGTPNRYRLISIKDPDNNTTTLAYNPPTGPTGSLWKVTAPDTRRLQFTYASTSPGAKLTSVKFIASTFNRTAKVSYNATTGRVSQVTLPNVTVNAVLRTYRVKFTTSTSENITKVTDEALNVWQYGYTGDAAIWALWPGNTAPAQRVEYSVPGANQVRVNDALDVETIFTFDSSGRRTTTRLDSGHEITYQWNDPDYAWGPSRVRSESIPPEDWVYDYDARGNIVARTPPGLGTFNYTYNAADRLTESLQPLVTDAYGVPDPARRRRVYLYSGTHNLTALRRYTDATNFVETTYAYDPKGNLVSATEPLTPPLVLTRDTRGNVTQLTTPAGRTIKWAYTSPGLTHGFTRPQSIEIDQAVGILNRDEWGRVKQQNFPDGSGATFIYDDGRGLLTSLTDPTGTTQWTYNAWGLPASQTKGAYTATHTYLANGLQSVRTESGPAGARTVSFSYDAMNRLRQVDDQGAVNDYEYDALGRLTRADYFNNAQTLRAYLNGRPDTITHKDGNGATIATVGYTYQSNGQRAGKTVSGVQTLYDYDMLDRLVREERVGFDDFLWQFDGADNLLSETRNGVVRGYARDADGLLQTATEGPSTWVYAANNAGRYTTRNASGAWRRYTYDFLGRLTDIDTGTNGTTWTPFRAYDYDGLDRRVTRKRLNSGGQVVSTRTFRYDGARMWGNERDLSGQITAGPLTWGGGGGLSDFVDHATSPSITYLPMTDAAGTAVAYLDPQGMAVPYTGVFNARGRQVVSSSTEPERGFLADLAVVFEEGPTGSASLGAGLAVFGAGSKWYDADNSAAMKSMPGADVPLLVNTGGWGGYPSKESSPDGYDSGPEAGDEGDSDSEGDSGSEGESPGGGSRSDSSDDDDDGIDGGIQDSQGADGGDGGSGEDGGGWEDPGGINGGTQSEEPKKPVAHSLPMKSTGNDTPQNETQSQD